MAVDSHNIILGSWSGTRRNVSIEFFDGAQKVWQLDFFGPPENFDDAFAIALYPQVEGALAELEIGIAIGLVEGYQNPDSSPTYLTQVEFDRRVLGYIMTIVDPHKLNACLPFWQAVQPRNGANATQRAANLGVPQVEYDEVEDRFNLYFGAATFLTNDLAGIWAEVKEAWE